MAGGEVLRIPAPQADAGVVRGVGEEEAPTFGDIGLPRTEDSQLGGEVFPDDEVEVPAVQAVAGLGGP